MIIVFRSVTVVGKLFWRWSLILSHRVMWEEAHVLLAELIHHLRPEDVHNRVDAVSAEGRL